MPNELTKMTIDEAIAYSEAKAEELMKAGMKYIAFCWGGYHDALVEIKNGNIILEQESKR